MSRLISEHLTTVIACSPGPCVIGSTMDDSDLDIFESPEGADASHHGERWPQFTADPRNRATACHACPGLCQERLPAMIPTTPAAFATPQGSGGFTPGARALDPRLAPPHTSVFLGRGAPSAGLGSLVDLPPPAHLIAAHSQLPAGRMAYNSHPPLPANNSVDAHAYKNSSSPEPGNNQGAQGKPHRRGYQACQNCRNRKVRCDLGSMCRRFCPFDTALTMPLRRCRCPERTTVRAVSARALALPIRAH